MRASIRLMGLRPCQRLGDLGRSRFSSNHCQIRSPHQHLKIRRNDVEMRRPVIVGVDTDADGAKALQCRHASPSINNATIALRTRNVNAGLEHLRNTHRGSILVNVYLTSAFGYLASIAKANGISRRIASEREGMSFRRRCTISHRRTDRLILSMPTPIEHPRTSQTERKSGPALGIELPCFAALEAIQGAPPRPPSRPDDIHARSV